RDGFNHDHEFSKALLDFLAEELKPYYEKERKRLEDQEKDKFSSETRKRIDETLKHLNKFFQQITEKDGEGSRAEDEKQEPSAEGEKGDAREYTYTVHNTTSKAKTQITDT